mgnify:CR=1 FL=1
MAETVRVLVEEEEVDKRIRDLGEQISKDYETRKRSASHLCIKRWRILLCANWQRELPCRCPWTL